MSILTGTKIICNNCEYEYPNNYYFGIIKWIEVICEDKEHSSIDKKHFCSTECLNAYFIDDNDYKIISQKEIIDLKQMLKKN